MGWFIVTALVVAVMAIAYIVRKQNKGEVRMLATFGMGLAFAFWGFMTALSSVVTVAAGHFGIVYAFSDIVNQRPSGLNWIYPWQSMTEASVQVQSHPFPKLNSFSKESQDVFVVATINIKVSPAHIQTLYRDVGKNYYEVLFVPRVMQAFKDETVKYSSVDIAPHRENIRKAVRARLSSELSSYSITVEDLLINDLDFRKEFKEAIEAKQIASQRALEEEQKIAAEKHRASQARERAAGEADSHFIRIQKEADGRFYIAQKEAEANKALADSISDKLVAYLTVQKLAPNVSVMMIPSNQGLILDKSVLQQSKPATK